MGENDTSSNRIRRRSTRVRATDGHPSETSTGPAGTTRCYVLFGGREEPPRGGLGDLVQISDCEQTMRNAFREMRLDRAVGWSWGQLAVFDGERGVQPLCWFGIGAKPERRPPPVPQSGRAGARQKGFLGRSVLLAHMFTIEKGSYRREEDSR